MRRIKVEIGDVRISLSNSAELYFNSLNYNQIFCRVLSFFNEIKFYLWMMMIFTRMRIKIYKLFYVSSFDRLGIFEKSIEDSRHVSSSLIRWGIYRRVGLLSRAGSFVKRSEPLLSFDHEIRPHR